MLDFSDAAQPDGMNYLSDGPINIPEDSVVDTESSDGQGFGFEEESDGDHEKDEDYVMDDAHKSSSDEEFKFDVDVDLGLDSETVKTTKVSQYFTFFYSSVTVLLILIKLARI